MKKIISLLISASLFLQIAVPATTLLTYAQTTNHYGFKWERTKGLDPQLGSKDSVEGSEEALVSWKADPETSNDYSLEYLIENKELETGPKAEKVRFTFNKGLDNKASVKLEILDLANNAKEKEYSIFDFSQTNPETSWPKTKANKAELEIVKDSKYQGGRIRVDNMEVRFRFRWEDGSVHFQTNQIKHGNITPFSLQEGIGGPKETINVLTGIEGYAIAPVHIRVGNGQLITNKEIMIVPGDKEEPGSKPGVRVNFKRPRQWVGTELKDVKGESIVATLEIEDLTDTAKTKLSFDLASGAIEEVSGKSFEYDDLSKTYSIYLAKEDENHHNIVKWKDLKESMIFKKVALSLIKKEEEGQKAQALGIFSPQPTTKGRHTYLGYTIERSSMEETFMKIKPYNGPKDTEYTYIVESAPNLSGLEGNWGELVEHKYVTTGGSTEKTFTIPVPFNQNHQYYRVIVKYGEVTMVSQILNYQADEDLKVPPPTPIIQSIDNIYAVPPRSLGDPPEAIGFDLTWSAPKNTSQNKLLNKLLEKGSIYYELFFHEDLESAQTRGILTKVFKVSLDADGKINVQPHAGSAGKDSTQVRYNASKDTFTMENIVLKNYKDPANPEKPLWEQIQIKGGPGNIDYHLGEQYPQFDVVNMESQEVPGIYYVTMRALYDLDAEDIAMGVSNTSNPKSITISPLEEIIPVPTQIESRPSPLENEPNIIRQTLSWGNVDLYRYIKQMLDPLNLYIDDQGEDKGVYEVYIHQNKKIKESDFKAITTPSAVVVNSAQGYKLQDKDVENLRKGKAIRLDYPGNNSGGTSSILLDALDANQVYYTTIRVRLDVKDKNKADFKETRYSVFSKEHSFTSYTKPSEPAPGERVPPVPEALQIVDQPNNTTATIGWQAPEYNKQEEEILYYEMIRVDGRHLAKEEDTRLLSIKKLLGDNKKDDIQAWRTKENFINKYTKGSDTWAKASPEQVSNKLELKDDGLSPNQIYYYYVRTVLIVEGQEVYSSWVGVPVTTEPVQKPIRLKVEAKEHYPHDPKREIVISFLAPIPKGSQIPSDYDFEIGVQGELDENYRLDYSTSRLTSIEKEEDIPTGYAHFVYKINHVKPGKRYDLKVRIIDKVVGMVNGQYPKSLYSDRVTTRTHFDQDEQDKEDKFAQYLKYFEDKVEALRRKPYWTLEEGVNEFSIKYRSNYIIPEINTSKTYHLAVKEGLTDFTYYMPASVIAAGNLSQSSFEIKQGAITYSLRPSMITPELEALKVALEDIKEKYIRDYYVAFNFKQRSPRISYGIDQVLSPEISVAIELVTLSEEDLFLEDDIIIALNNEINREKIMFIEDLEKALERGKILDEDLEFIINRSIGSIEKNHQKDVRNIIKRNTKKISLIPKWNKSMLIMATIEGNTVAQAYERGWQDMALPSFNLGLGYGVEVSQGGTYIFKGQKVNMPVIPGLGSANSLIAKYQLTDFFGVNGNINPSNMAIKKDVLGAMARVLGAPRGADYTQYLKQTGIKGVTNMGMNLPIKKGEGIYLLMQVYEKNFKKPIASVHVKNRNVISNLQQFNRLHQPYVLVAVDAKIMGQGSGLKPNDSMQIKDVLQILTNIMAENR